MRTPEHVAKRALISTCLAFRASLETTDHPRSAGISANLLPWLEKHDIAGELDPIEREILETSHRQLRKDQQSDVNWSGEAAWVFAWALKLVEKPPACECVDYRVLVRQTDILNGNAAAFVAAAALRSEAELAAFCVETLAIRNELQKRSLPGAPNEVLDGVLIQRLSRMGLTTSELQLKQASQFVNDRTDDERRNVAGIYFVRALAASWLHDERPSYFA